LLSENFFKFIPFSQSLFWAEAVLRTKQIFNNFFLGLINNFIPLYKPNIEEELIMNSANEIFQFDAYVKLFPSENAQFYKEFSTKTMVKNITVGRASGWHL
jgi:hypothetical protein